MIIVNMYKKIVIVNQLTDFEAFGGHKSIIQLSYHGETLQGLFRYLKRLFRGVTQRVRTSGERILKTFPLEMFLLKISDPKDEERTKNDNYRPKSPYKLTSDVKDDILKYQAMNPMVGFRKVTKKVSKDTDTSISYESVRQVVNGSFMGFFKKGLRKIFTRGAKKPNDYKIDSKEELATDQEGHHNKITLFHGRSRREKFLHSATTGITSRYAFLLFLVAYFPQIGFYEFSAKLDTARQKGFSDLELLLTLLFMPFLGCTRLEHIGTLPLLDFQPLIAKTVVPSADCMRDYLKQLASLPELDQKIDTLYQGWVQRGLIDGRAVYLDRHVIEYFGEKSLEKTKHGVKNKLVKALLRYCPYDMVTNIPLGNIFVPASTKLSVKILQFIGRTEKTTGRHIELVIFDRGGNNLEVFKKLQQRNTHYSAWAKDNYVAIKTLKNQVNKAFISIDKVVTAALHRRRVARKKAAEYEPTKLKVWDKALSDDYIYNYAKRVSRKLSQQNKSAKKDRLFIALWDTHADVRGLGLVRTILARRFDGTEVGIYTSLPVKDITAVEIVLLMARRWREENFFRIQMRDLASGNIWGWPTYPVELNVLDVSLNGGVKQNITELSHHLGKIAQNITKYEEKREELQQLYVNKILDKHDLKLLQKRQDRLLAKQRKEQAILSTLRRKLETGESDIKSVSHRVVERVSYERALILTSFRDLLYVACRLFCSDLARCFSKILEKAVVTNRSTKASKYENLTPTRLNRLFFQQGGQITLSPAGDTLFVHLHAPHGDPWPEVLHLLAQKLNANHSRLHLGRGVSFTLHYSVL